MKRPSGWDRKGRSSNRKLPEAVRRKVFRKHPYCWLAIPGKCSGKSTQVHHTNPVADGGTDDIDLLVGVCEPCHTYISAQDSQRRSVDAAWDFKRKPERPPGLLH